MEILMNTKGLVSLEEKPPKPVPEPKVAFTIDHFFMENLKLDPEFI